MAYDITGDSLLLDIADGIATVTLNRPARKNALSRELRNNILAVLRGARDDAAVGVLIFTGAGDQAFSVGADLHELEVAPLHRDEMGIQSPTMQAFAALGKPTIAAVNGYAITGGFELVVNCDLVLATPNAKFADTHARVGIMSAWGLSQFLPRLIGPMRARYLSLTGNFLDARTAQEWGLVLEVLEHDALLPRCREIARTMLDCDQPTLRELHRAIRHGQMHGLSEGLALEGELAQGSLDRFDPARFAATRGAVFRRGRDQASSAV